MSVFMDRGMKSDSSVFVIEGDADVCATIKALVQPLGIAVETYDSAQSFLDFFRPEKPGCLVVDLRLPGMGRASAHKWDDWAAWAIWRRIVFCRFLRKMQSVRLRHRRM